MTPSAPHLAALLEIPSVGPAVARRLHALGVHRLEDLRGRDPDELFARACALAGRPEDPCLLDTFAAVIEIADGGEARPWWELSAERIARVRDHHPGSAGPEAA